MGSDGAAKTPDLRPWFQVVTKLKSPSFRDSLWMTPFCIPCQFAEMMSSMCLLGKVHGNEPDLSHGIERVTFNMATFVVEDQPIWAFRPRDSLS